MSGLGQREVEMLSESQNILDGLLSSWKNVGRKGEGAIQVGLERQPT